MKKPKWYSYLNPLVLGWLLAYIVVEITARIINNSDDTINYILNKK